MLWKWDEFMRWRGRIFLLIALWFAYSYLFLGVVDFVWFSLLVEWMNYYHDLFCCCTLADLNNTCLIWFGLEDICLICVVVDFSFSFCMHVIVKEYLYKSLEYLLTLIIVLFFSTIIISYAWMKSQILNYMNTYK